MAINLEIPNINELKPRIIVFGVGGAGGNAVNNMIETGLPGVDFVVANTDAQALNSSKSERIIQMGLAVTEGLGAGSQPEVGRAAAEEVIDEIRDQLAGAHMVFITAGMGGGTGTGAASVIARAARDMGILTVGVVTKPFQFEGVRRMRIAEAGITELQQAVDTLIVIPNQNLFRVANEKTTFADAFSMADQVLYSGVACITDLMVKEGLINLDFADVRSIMRGMGKAMMGTGESTGDKRALRAAEAAIANPLLDDVCMKGARGLLISISGGHDLTLYEVDEAATRIREEVDQDANIILGATFDETLEGVIRVSVVATGIEPIMVRTDVMETEQRIAAVAEKLRSEARARAAQNQISAQPQIAASLINTQAQATNQGYVSAPLARGNPTLPAITPVQQRINDATLSTQARGVQQYIPQEAVNLSHVQSLPTTVELQREATSSAAVTSSTTTASQPQYNATQSVEDVSNIDFDFLNQEAQKNSAIESVAAPEYSAPVVERELARPPRMPRIDELPMTVQNQLQAQLQQADEMREVTHPSASPVEQKRMTLLQRLASVGLGAARTGRETSSQLPSEPLAPLAPREPVQPTAHQEYTKRANPTVPPRMNQEQNDVQQRTVPVVRSGSEEEQFEIPAFLRRQSN